LSALYHEAKPIKPDSGSRAGCARALARPRGPLIEWSSRNPCHGSPLLLGESRHSSGVATATVIEPAFERRHGYAPQARTSSRPWSSKSAGAWGASPKRGHRQIVSTGSRAGPRRHCARRRGRYKAVLPCPACRQGGWVSSHRGSHSARLGIAAETPPSAPPDGRTTSGAPCWARPPSPTHPPPDPPSSCLAARGAPPGSAAHLRAREGHKCA
jgi:hypothetical protein